MKKLKFLADVNVEKTVVDFLRGNGYDVRWVPDFDCDILDEDLLTRARVQGRILITNDKDFGELIFLQKRLSSGIILLRVKGQNASKKVTLMRKLLSTHSNRLCGSFVTVTEKRFRFVPLEDV